MAGDPAAEPDARLHFVTLRPCHVFTFLPQHHWFTQGTAWCRIYYPGKEGIHAEPPIRADLHDLFSYRDNTYSRMLAVECLGWGVS